jgi:hypothetical protein
MLDPIQIANQFTSAEVAFLQALADHSYTDGQLLIGNSSTGGLTIATLTQGTNMTITNGHGTITLASSGSGGGGSLTVGTTTISSGTNTYIEYNNNGVLGEYAISGSGSVAMTTSPSFTTPTLGAASATSINGLTITSSTGTLTISNGKTLTLSHTMQFTAADDTGVYTFPTGTNTLVATTVATLSSLASVGTITTGTWNATTIAIAHGGTGVTSVTTAPGASAWAGWDANSNLSANNLIDGFTTTATAGTTTTMTIAATGIQVWTGSSNQTIKLPTTSVVAGGQYTIVNAGTGALTVQSSGANTITVVAAGTSAIFTAVVATPTTAANWNSQYIGATAASGGSLTTSGAYPITLTATASTGVTLPTSGTLVNSAVATLSSLTSVGTITTGGLGTGATLGSVTVNIASTAVGDIWYAGASNVMTRLADVTAGQPLLSGGVTTAPAYAGYTFSATASQTYTFPGSTSTLAGLGVAQTWSALQSFNDGDLGLKGSSSGTMILHAPAAASTYAMTFPAASDTVAVLGTAQTFTAQEKFNNIVDVNNAVSVSSNAGTVPVTYRLNTFTNSSAATMTITMTTTSAVDGQMTIVRIYDFSGVAETISWVNTENSTVTAPTTSNGSTTLPLTVGFMYNAQTSKWRCIALA